ncbi:hypothetical protein [Aquabacter cavernae]|uniref:hypothetical protein n=1 Tax=Aquabacter cavernae TaxID=2496029 RepID=UPI000F8E00B9|nr:hypothetical protein [Aquabacter cavernae]
MAYRLCMKVQSVDAAIRALDLLRRLDVDMLELETARREEGFLVHLSYDACGEEAARHIAVRMGQIVGVSTAEMVTGHMPEPGPFATALPLRSAC